MLGLIPGTAAKLLFPVFEAEIKSDTDDTGSSIYYAVVEIPGTYAEASLQYKGIGKIFL
jgi:hypothetical protein